METRTAKPVIAPLSRVGYVSTERTHCGRDRVVFNGLVGSTGKVVSICRHTGGGSEPSGLSYRYGAPGHVELEFPKRRASYKPFILRQYVRPRTTYLKFEFTSNGFNYAILEDFEADQKPQTTAFLRVTRLSDSKVISERHLSPTTKPLSLLGVADLVPNAPFDE